MNPIKKFKATVSNADGTHEESFPVDESAWDAEQTEEIEKLNVSESVSFGGGSSPIFRFTRIN